jgi:spermidine synthase
MRCWSSGLARAGCSLAALPPVSGVYSALAGHGPLAILIRAIVCAVCLLPPTVLMGATLPAASRFVESTPRGVAWTGFLYGGNTVGAVFGSVFAGFYLLRVYDLTIATLVAAFVNALVASLGFALSRRAAPANLASPGAALIAGSTSRVPHIVIALSGAAALGAEVVWTRLLSLMLGATTYTFSMILGVFLTGLGIGSAAGAAIGKTSPRARLALGAAQLMLMLAVCFAALMVGRSPRSRAALATSGTPRSLNR